MTPPTEPTPALDAPLPLSDADIEHMESVAVLCLDPDPNVWQPALEDWVGDEGSPFRVLCLFATLDQARAELAAATKRTDGSAFTKVFGESYTPQTGKGRHELQLPENIRLAVATSGPLTSDVIAALLWQMQIRDNRDEFYQAHFEKLERELAAEKERREKLEAGYYEANEVLPASSCEVAVELSNGQFVLACYEREMWEFYSDTEQDLHVVRWRYPQSPAKEGIDAPTD